MAVKSRAGGGRGGGARKIEKDTPRAMAMAVSEYLGVPVEENVQVLSSDEFDKRFGSPDDAVHGGIAAIRTPDGDIFIREGYESDAIHELVHSSGALEEGVGAFLNEGITQTAAEAIGQRIGIDVRQTYGKETNFVREYVLPTVGISEREFLSGYAKAGNKGKYIRDLVWEKHGPLFSDAREWGTNPKGRMLNDIANTLGTSMYLSYLVDEVGV